MPTITLEEIEDQVWARLDGNTAFYPEPLIRSRINEGLRRLNNLTGFNQTTVPIDGQFTTAGAYLYNTPAGILIPMSVWFEARELRKSSLRKLGLARRSWTTDTRANAGPVEYWLPISITQFAINPADSVGGQLLEVSGVAPITPLVNQDDKVTLQDEFVEILVEYAECRAQLRVGGQPFALSSLAYQRMIHALKGKVLFENMKFPKYWLLKELEASQGRAT